jgi:hypothetical protein
MPPAASSPPAQLHTAAALAAAAHFTLIWPQPADLHSQQRPTHQKEPCFTLHAACAAACTEHHQLAQIQGTSYTTQLPQHTNPNCKALETKSPAMHSVTPATGAALPAAVAQLCIRSEAARHRHTSRAHAQATSCFAHRCPAPTSHSPSLPSFQPLHQHEESF